MTERELKEYLQINHIPIYCLNWHDNPKIVRALRILEEYIAFWSDEVNINNNDEVTPIEVLQSLKEKLVYDKTDKLMKNIDFEIIEGKIRIKKGVKRYE